jgi:hypothetical protein
MWLLIKQLLIKQQSKTLETFEIFNQKYLYIYFAPSNEPYNW